MEIEIDHLKVRTILTQESRQSAAEIEQHGVVRAYADSQRRLDERLAAAPDASTLACKAGCYWCCYFTVDVRPVEVFRILDFMATELPPAEQTRIREEIVANSTKLSQLDEDARVMQTLKCPFLAAGRCTIYTARPQTCRNYHATDSRGCQQSFEEPDNLDIDPEFAPFVYQIGAAHVDAFSGTMRKAGYDVAAYEMNGALARAMKDPVAARDKFENREAPFGDLQRGEVLLQFSDIDALE
jgi:Fe-S-cluster containining protein